MRNVLAHVPQADKSIVAAAIRTVYAQRDQTAAKEQLREVVRAMEPRRPRAAEVLAGGEEEVLTQMTFPAEHWSRIYSTNPLEWLNREVKRRADVVGIFPGADEVLRLVGSVLIEIHDEWQAEWRNFSLDSMTKLKEPQGLLPVRTDALTGPSLQPPGERSRRRIRPCAHWKLPPDLHHLTRRQR